MCNEAFVYMPLLRGIRSKRQANGSINISLLRSEDTAPSHVALRHLSLSLLVIFILDNRRHIS